VGPLGLYDERLQQFYASDQTPVLVPEHASDPFHPEQLDELPKKADREGLDLEERVRKAVGLSKSGPLGMVALQDLSIFHLLYQLPLPPLVTVELTNAISEHNASRLRAMLRADSEFCHQVVGPFVREILHDFHRVVNDEMPSPRLRIYAGHDSSLFLLLVAWELMTEVWKLLGRHMRAV